MESTQEQLQHTNPDDENQPQEVSDEFINN